jgi:hypothetical protein
MDSSVSTITYNVIQTFGIQSVITSSSGIVTSGSGILTPAQVAGIPDSGVKHQCVGGCFSFEVTGAAAEGAVDVVLLKLMEGIPRNPSYRAYTNGTWQDLAVPDTVKSAPANPVTGLCPPPGHTSYGEVTPGHTCVELSLTDNSPNDTNLVTGAIGSLSGFAEANTGATSSPTLSTSSGGGCTISRRPKSVWEGDHGWLMVIIIAWLGWIRRRSGRRCWRNNTIRLAGSAKR